MEQMSPKQKAARNTHSQELAIQLDARVTYTSGREGKEKASQVFIILEK